jgi:hypothetical protein
MAARQDPLIADDQGVALGRWELRVTLRPRLLGRRAHLQRQVLELLCPGVLVLLLRKRQFAQVVDVAERVATCRVRLLRFPAVMDVHARYPGRMPMASVASFPRLAWML